MAKKTIKAWAVVGGGHRFSPAVDIRNARSEARFIAGFRGKGAKALPITITIHTKAKGGG